MRIDKVIFMLNKLLTDLQARGKYVPLSDNVDSAKLDYYYLLFGTDLSKLNKLIQSFDPDGIPLNAAYIDVEGGKPHYYPISIGQYGLSIFHEYLATGSPQKQSHFLRIADWFVDHRQEDDRTGTYWLTEIPKPEYKVFKPWKSAFTQSRALSILLRAWQLTGRDHYLAIATQALQPFGLDISQDGVSIRKPGYEIFYEEYVAASPTRVLDGHIFSLFGLYDYVRAIPIEIDAEGHHQALKLFNEGIEGLLQSLPKYDLGYWILFNRCEVPGYPAYDPCTINYLQLIIQQIKVLYMITGRDEFNRYRERFENYLGWTNIYKMYRTKFRALQNLNRI